MAAIDINSLRYRYTDAEAVLAGIDLRIADGEAHAILGGSGAGKTTLLNLLAGLLEPQSGTIRFDGRDMTGLGGAERNVAQVFQFPVLYPSLNVAENLGFALGNRGWSKRAVRARVGEVAELLQIDSLLGRRPRALSLFEKQLVAIGRALARPDVAVVLLDEPLTAVEPATKWRLRRALKTVQQELALTMVYVTHDQAEALTFADRITMLDQGAVLQTGTPLEFYEAPAHTAVAGFIGSPGMNLVEAEAGGGKLRVGERVVATGRFADGRWVIGFRPEWASIEASRPGAESDIPVTVQGIRVLGTEEGAPVGLLTARLGGTTVHVRQRLDRFPAQDPGRTHSGDRDRQAPHGSFDGPVSVFMRIDPTRLVMYRNDRLVSHAA